MFGAVTPEGITADLEAMHRIGVGGAYLMPIKGVEPVSYTHLDVYKRQVAGSAEGCGWKRNSEYGWQCGRYLGFGA